MKIYPAIDLLEGQVVRLLRGRFEDKTVYASDPIEVAKNFAACGASYLHIVDLSGTKKGATSQTALILKIIRNSTLKVQVGGGLRSIDDVQRLLDGGGDRVILGSLAVQNPTLTSSILKQFGPAKIIASFDILMNQSQIPMVATDGWQKVSNKSLWQILDDFSRDGLKQILCTDIAQDGTLKGPNFDLYRKILDLRPECKLIASGGVGTVQDLKTLKKMGVESTIIGKALYENKFSLEQALQC